MRRREFIARLAGTTLAWPIVAMAQRPAVPFVGFLNSGSPNERAHLVNAFRQGLKDGGLVDGKDVAIEYRWAEGDYERLPDLARELVQRSVAVIAATGGNLPALAAKSATSTIPIVFTGGSDPVKLGLVASLARPGANLTGVTNTAASLQTKRLEILREFIPSATRIAYLVNQKAANVSLLAKELESAAKSSGSKIETVQASTEGEIDAAFGVIAKRRANALFVASDSFFISRRDQIVRLAARNKIPACYGFREFVQRGGLMSYGPPIAEGYRQAGAYTARILKGAKPGDLPVVQLSKLELVLNVKTARELGLNISRDFLARIDEAIE